MPLTTKKRILIRRWVAAVLIALAVGTVIYLIATRSNRSATDLYKSYYHPSITLLQGDSAANKTILTEARQAFKRQDYQQAAQLLGRAMETEPANESIQLALGICQLELGEIKNAKQSFSIIDTPPYREKAQWYLAMIFLKQSDVRNAQTILESIEAGAPNYEAAQDILQRL